jgi:hypothetical protein
MDLDDLALDDLEDAAMLTTSDRRLPVDGDAPVKMNAVKALKYIDDNWYKKIAGKKARWMDLIGDYAGNERFILDGNGHFSHRGQWIADMPFCT